MTCDEHDLTYLAAVRTHRKTSCMGMLPVILPLDVIKSTFTCHQNSSQSAHTTWQAVYDRVYRQHEPDIAHGQSRHRGRHRIGIVNLEGGVSVERPKSNALRQGCRLLITVQACRYVVAPVQFPRAGRVLWACAPQPANGHGSDVSATVLGCTQPTARHPSAKSQTKSRKTTGHRQTQY